jgi:hypothetical protein
VSAAAHPLLEELTPPGSRRKLEVVDRSHGVDLARAERDVKDLLAVCCLKPKGVRVVLEAVTSALQGRLRADPRSRQEFLALTNTAT